MIVKKSSVPIKSKSKNPWSWIPTLYFAEGFPFIVITSVSVIMYKRLGISNSDIALYTSWLYLPWVLKPLWSPIVDVLKTKRNWITSLQLTIGIGLAGVAFTIPAPDFFQFSLAFFWLLAFSSATHDIAADGFYMLALTEHEQSFFIGIKNALNKIAFIAGQSLLIILAGFLESFLSVEPAELKVVVKPDKFFQNTIQLDSSGIKEFPGKLRIITKPSVIEIGTKPISQQSVDFYTSFAKRFNIMNGFTQDELPAPDTNISNELVGNIGIVKFHLSKKPDDNYEYLVKIDFIEGSTGIDIIEGNTFKFTSKNWNKPAFAVLQIDPTLQKNVESIFKIQSDKVPIAWVFTFLAASLLFIFFFFYHKIFLPAPPKDKSVSSFHRINAAKEFFRSFMRFFEKEKILVILAFIISFQLGTAQVAKISSSFMLDSRELGGLGLSTSQVGFIQGMIGMIALIVGGLLGGFLISKSGLKKWFLWMLIAFNLPNLVFVYMSYFQPQNQLIIYSCIAFNQFGYGFGMAAFFIFLIYVSEGEYKTSHYALASGFMVLGIMIWGMLSGTIQETIGYKYFFIWILIAAIPSFVIAKYIPLDSSFGKRKTFNNISQ